MSRWSLIIGILGVCGAAVWLRSRMQHGASDAAQRSWLVGLASLFPAWLLAFVGLLSSPAGLEGTDSLPLSALFSSGAGLLGVVLTDAAVRQLLASGRARHPVLYWLLGVVSLMPAWCIALLHL